MGCIVTNIVNIWPGISNTMFHQLQAKVSCMDSNERNCILLFDEMRIKKGFDFHEKRQKIEGFQDLGSLGCNATVMTSVIEAVLNTGLKLRAFVCDQGTNNQSAVKNKISINHPYFMHGQEKIYVIFDISHIYKSIRNQLLKYDILYDDNKIASWNDVRSLWQLKNDKATRAACKLSDKHVNPNHFDRMKCRLATSI
ncbi:hypothetical protein ALC60_13083 [Trachymyrmex zeteki]|uniref:THAP domain-containing protein 9 n=1 Tax=Mycetomoellerius zeteki TaxID=64791 RepID=A0A151WJ64_9HYME|nr:hypothetical protein ALC60_13083 [Trachymyrmex zeteki]